MDNLKMKVLDILYPNVCDCCGVRIPFNQRICVECEKSLHELEISAEQWQKGKNVPWDGLVTAYSYEGTAKKGVIALKRGRRGFLQVAADKLADTAKNSLPIAECDVITYVPMVRLRRRMQGYGHTELLANAIGKRLSLPVRGKYLKEMFVGKFRQHDLSAQDRKIYAQRFVRTSASVEGKTILLCDDILTTGSTLMYCTSLLKKTGAKRVYVLTITCRIRENGDT